MKLELRLNKKQQATFARRATQNGFDVQEYTRRIVLAYANDPASILPAPLVSMTKKIKQRVQIALKSYESGKTTQIQSFRELVLGEFLFKTRQESEFHGARGQRLF